MSDSLNSKCLKFLYKWVNDGKLGHLRKGMVEEFEQFVQHELGEAQVQQVAERMSAAKMLQSMPPVKESSDAKDSE